MFIIKYSGDFSLSGGAEKDNDPLESTSPGMPEALFDVASSGSENVKQYALATFKNVRRHLVESAKLDINPLLKRNVTLLLTPLAGFGDILFVYKSCQALKSQGFNLSISISEVDGVDLPAVKRQLQQMKNMSDVEIVTPDEPGAGDFIPDCIIIAPTSPEEEDMIKLRASPVSVPMGVINEYGGSRTIDEDINPFNNPDLWPEGEGDFLLFDVDKYIDNVSINAGIGPGELGIFTENGLTTPLTEEEKRIKLDLLKESNPKIVEPILNDRSAGAYLNSTNLFFGYAHRALSMRKFVSTIAFSEQLADSKKNIDIILPWRLEDTKASEFNEKCHINRDELKDAGIGRVIIVNSDGIFEENISEDGMGKVLRIINLFPFSNSLMRDLLTVSEAPMLITGDQSWNEAMLMPDKIILYEEMEWKIDLYRSMVKKSTPYPLVSNLMNAWKDREDSSSKGAANAILDLKADVLSSARAEKSQLEKFHESIINRENQLEKSIVQEALRLSALGIIPKFKEHSEKIEEKIKEIFYTPMLIEEFSKLLLFIIKFPAARNLDDNMIIIDAFRKKFNVIDKSMLTEDVLKTIKEGIDLVYKIYKSKGRGRSVNIHLEKKLATLSTKLLPIIEKKLRRVFEKN